MAEKNVIVDTDQFVSHPGFATINKTIFAHLDPKSLANCRLVSKSWKNFIDTSKTILLVQIHQLMHYDMKLEGTYDPQDNSYLVESIIEHWPSYDRVLSFMKTEATLEEIKVFLVFLREFCRTNLLLKCIFQSDFRSPMRAFQVKNSLIIGIFLKSLYPDEKCICKQVQNFNDKERLEYKLWMKFKTKKVMLYYPRLCLLCDP